MDDAIATTREALTKGEAERARLLRDNETLSRAATELSERETALKERVRKLEGALRALVAEEFVCAGRCLCCGRSISGRARADEHDADCPWVKAGALLGEEDKP